MSSPPVNTLHNKKETQPDLIQNVTNRQGINQRAHMDKQYTEMKTPSLKKFGNFFPKVFICINPKIFKTITINFLSLKLSDEHNPNGRDSSSSCKVSSESHVLSGYRSSMASPSDYNTSSDSCCGYF